jgi:hypothetical protein
MSLGWLLALTVLLLGLNAHTQEEITVGAGDTAVYGQVTDKLGRPIEGAKVTVMRSPNGNWGTKAAPVFEMRTDGAGRYRGALKGPVIATYLRVEVEGYYTRDAMCHRLGQLDGYAEDDYRRILQGHTIVPYRKVREMDILALHDLEGEELREALAVVLGCGVWNELIFDDRILGRIFRDGERLREPIASLAESGPAKEMARHVHTLLFGAPNEGRAVWPTSGDVIRVAGRTITEVPGDVNGASLGQVFSKGSQMLAGPERIMVLDEVYPNETNTEFAVFCHLRYADTLYPIETVGHRYWILFIARTGEGWDLKCMRYLF